MKGYIERLRDRGISVRGTYVIVIMVIMVAASVIIYKTHEVHEAYDELSAATDDYMILTSAADDLMSASDFLTQEVQSFVVTRDVEHAWSYFAEAETYRHREESLKIMGTKAGDTEAFRQLQEAYNASMKLMEREYYAMKLVLVACNINEYPKTLEAVEISAADMARSGEKKLELAQDMVYGKGYYQQKDIIRAKMELCVTSIEKDTHGIQIESDRIMRKKLSFLRWEMIALTFVVIIVLLLTLDLIIRPLHKCVKHIEANQSLEVVGGSEFRKLARTYNKMYELQKQSMEELNYEATHDALTGLYNRAGYEYVKSTLNVRSTAMILIDCDRFKTINDTMGHEIGDKILIKLSNALRREFRSEDYICRIGGDEFLIFIVNPDRKLRALIKSRIKNVNETMHNTADGLPDSSISAGVALGKNESDFDTMFRHADLALYKMKEQRSGCAFYTE